MNLEEMLPSQTIGLPEVFIKTVDHFVPDFWKALKNVADSRNPDLITYPIEEELLLGILLFVVKLEARRNLKFKLNSPALIKNLKGIAGLVFSESKFADTIPH